MNISITTMQSWVAISLEGTLTIKNCTLIRSYLEQAEATPVPGIVIDMGKVTQLDSCGITLLLNFQKRIIRKEGHLVLAGITEEVTEIFSIVGIDKIFRICKDMDEFKRSYCG